MIQKNSSLYHRFLTRNRFSFKPILCAYVIAPFLFSPLTQAESGREDYDIDDNGLIEINDLDDFNEIRNNLDGSALYGENIGCPAGGCYGFELTRDLDFDTDQNGRFHSGDTYWDDAKGWVPLGDSNQPFTAVFNGNYYKILNLRIARPLQDRVGVFGATDDAQIRNVGINGQVLGREFVGSLTGQSRFTTVENVFFLGDVIGDRNVGGIIGDQNSGMTKAVYAAGTLRSERDGGGIVGYVLNNGIVDAAVSEMRINGQQFTGGIVGTFISGHLRSSAAFGLVSNVDNNVGGLIGWSDDDFVNVSDSYWSTDSTGQITFSGGGVVAPSDGGVGALNAELRCPTTADNTSCTGSPLYEGWGAYTKSDSQPLWNFGAVQDLPTMRFGSSLVRDSDGDLVIDADDAFPEQIAATTDADNDGMPDFWWVRCDFSCQQESGLTLDPFPGDFDNDGVPDSSNLPPTVTLAITQNQETVTLVNRASGDITVTAIISDENLDDEHTVEWFFNERVLVTDENQFSVSLPSRFLVDGDTISAVVTDNGTPSLSSEKATTTIAILTDTDDIDTTDITDLIDAIDGIDTTDTTDITDLIDAIDNNGMNGGDSTSSNNSSGGGGSTDVIILFLLGLFGYLRMGKSNR